MLCYHQIYIPCQNPLSVHEVYVVMLYELIYTMHTQSQSSPLNPKRLNVINLLHSLRSQYERILFQHANAIFDADAHAAEVGGVSFCVGYVEAAVRHIKY